MHKHYAKTISNLIFRYIFAFIFIFVINIGLMIVNDNFIFLLAKHVQKLY